MNPNLIGGRIWREVWFGAQEESMGRILGS